MAENQPDQDNPVGQAATEVEPASPQGADKPNGQKKLFGKQTYIVAAILLLIVLITSVIYFFSSGFLPSSAPVASPVASAPRELTLNLMSPSDQELAVNGEVLVKGSTLPNTTVMMFTESDESSVESDAEGFFESTLLLDEGINTLVVTAFAQDGQEKTVVVDVVFDSES